MKIIRAELLSMCFGVRDAIKLAIHQSEKEPVTILGELVHNETVNAALRNKGIQIQSRLEDITTNTVIVTAHGASEQAMKRTKEQGHFVLEATCPLVHFAHRSVASLVNAGFHPVIIGKLDHVAARGMTEDLAEFDVVLTEEDVMNLKERPRFGIASQTTQPIDRVRWLVKLIRDRYPRSEVRFIDTVCQPTKQRQSAAIALARQCDIVVVIGGVNSNNTRELAETCRRFCDQVIQIQNASELKPHLFYNAQMVGITAGTSTPDSVIHDVEQKLHKFTQKSEN